MAVQVMSCKFGGLMYNASFLIHSLLNSQKGWNQLRK